MELQAFRKLIASGETHHTYILHVQEEYDYQNLLVEIKEALFKGELNEFNTEKLDGKESNLLEVINIARTTRSCPS